MNLFLEQLKMYVAELNERGIEVWVRFYPDPVNMHIKVKKGDVCFEDCIDYDDFGMDLLLSKTIRNLVNKVETAMSEQKGEQK